MASSSKKQKTNASQRSQGTSMESNPLDLIKLLANDNQRKVFEEHFHCKPIFTPKFELQMMSAIKMNIKINWSEMIMRQIWNVRGTQSPLPYAILITNFLQHFGVSINGETKVPLNLRRSKIDVEVVHKMGFSADPRDRSGRTYRHQLDREPAPADQTEPSPCCPQPSEFHAQSSSSIVMPSNQMIMDELHSLRGYITNRMDALDTQNQQIQYELHCISSKLRSMEVDEDSSEPES
ncbi:unnamed protein product [Lupinus luteus]|uniref:Uncharacterized protein n=1 Tax=Lupinus luteus TaxID=3873 RepID=A0AAV1WYE3_LUPLU